MHAQPNHHAVVQLGTIATDAERQSGDVWPAADRKLWLDLLEGSLKLSYKDASEETKLSLGERMKARAESKKDEAAN